MKYLYQGPSSGVTLNHGQVSKEILLHPNAEVELHENDTYTKVLIALKHLSSLPVSKSPITTAETPSMPANPCYLDD